MERQGTLDPGLEPFIVRPTATAKRPGLDILCRVDAHTMRTKKPDFVRPDHDWGFRNPEPWDGLPSDAAPDASDV